MICNIHIAVKIYTYGFWCLWYGIIFKMYYLWIQEGMQNMIFLILQRYIHRDTSII